GLRSQLAGRARADVLTADERALWDALTAHDKMRVRAIITVAIEPINAWPIANLLDASRGPEHARFTREAQHWAAERYAAAELANAVATQIAKRLAIMTIVSADDVRRKVLAEFDALDCD